MNARRKSRREVLKAIAPTGRRAEMPTNLRSEVQTITPHMATVWLEGKTPNRSVSDPLVERFARDMRAGAWHLNGEAIVFDEDGALMDGQHRLWAIVMAQVPITSLVVFGAKKASMETYDTGRARTFSDALKIRGKHHTTLIASAARWFHWYDHSGTGTTIGAGVANPTHHELNRSIAAHPTIEAAAELVGKKRAGKKVSPGILTFVMAGALERDPDKAEAFVDQLGSGLALSETSPIYHLRNKLDANIAAKAKLRPMVIAAYVMKAWNAYYQSQPMRHLKWNNEGEKPESFPKFED